METVFIASMWTLLICFFAVHMMKTMILDAIVVVGSTFVIPDSKVIVFPVRFHRISVNDQPKW